MPALQLAPNKRRGGHKCLQAAGDDETFNSLFRCPARGGSSAHRASEWGLGKAHRGGEARRTMPGGACAPLLFWRPGAVASSVCDPRRNTLFARTDHGRHLARLSCPRIPGASPPTGPQRPQLVAGNQPQHQGQGGTAGGRSSAGALAGGPATPRHGLAGRPVVPRPDLRLCHKRSASRRLGDGPRRREPSAAGACRRRATHAPSPDARYEHPVLRSLGCRLRSAILAALGGIRRLPGHG
jgi:hypothetical protein